MGRKVDAETKLIREFANLLSTDFYVLWANKTSLKGTRGLDALHVIVNALYEAEYPDEFESNPLFDVEPSRAPVVAAAIKRLARRNKTPFVVCYQLAGSRRFRLASSEGQTLAEAGEMLLELIESGTLIDRNDFMPGMSVYIPAS